MNAKPMPARYYREMDKAAGRVSWAIRKGIIPPISAGTSCADCGGQAEEYDHRDYERPLEVVPVCASCNCKRGKAYWSGEPDPKGGLPALDPDFYPRLSAVIPP